MILDGLSSKESEQAKQFLKTADSYGWVCSRTSNGHWLCKAPDGQTKITIAPKMYGKVARSYLSRLEKWMEGNPTPEPERPAPEAPQVTRTGPSAPVVLPYRTANGKLSKAMVKVLYPDRRNETMLRCADCDFEMPEDSPVLVMVRHRRKHSPNPQGWKAVQAARDRKKQAAQQDEEFQRALSSTAEPEPVEEPEPQSPQGDSGITEEAAVAALMGLLRERNELRKEVERLRAERQALRELLT